MINRSSVVLPEMPEIPEDTKFKLNIYRDSTGKVVGAELNDFMLGRVLKVQQVLDNGNLNAIITLTVDTIETNPYGFEEEQPAVEPPVESEVEEPVE